MICNPVVTLNLRPVTSHPKYPVSSPVILGHGVSEMANIFKSYPVPLSHGGFVECQDLAAKLQVSRYLLPSRVWAGCRYWIGGG